jgi:hypothetical protein
MKEQVNQQKNTYVRPVFRRFGALREMTKGSTGSSADKATTGTYPSTGSSKPAPSPQTPGR